MNALPDLQHAFQDYLFGQNEGFRAEIRDTTRTDRDTLLAVYRDGYTLRLLEALGDEYPGLRAMLGEAGFDTLGRAYAARHPSRHPSIRWFGRGMADFIAASTDWSAIGGLADMARFEWALGEAFDAADAAVLGAEALMKLAAADWQSVRFEPLPSLRRLDLDWNVPQIWQAHETTEPGLLRASRESAPVAWVVWRPALETQFRSMEVDETRALDVLRSGQGFPTICESVIDFVGEEAAPARAAGLLRAWIEAGMIAAAIVDHD